MLRVKYFCGSVEIIVVDYPAVIYAERVVEGQLVVGQPKRIVASSSEESSWSASARWAAGSGARSASRRPPPYKADSDQGVGLEDARDPQFRDEIAGAISEAAEAPAVLVHGLGQNQ